jgi:hypothetical protein
MCPRGSARAAGGAVTILALLLLHPTSSKAQVSTRGQTLGRMEIALTGTITSSVALTVEGSVNQNGGVSTIVTGSGNRGTVDFGNFRAGAPGTGELFHVDGPVKGSYLVATLRLKTHFSGSGGAHAVLDIQRASPCGGTPGLPCGHPGSLFYAKMSRRAPNQAVAWPTWDRYPDANFGSSVFSVPDETYVPGAGNLDDLMANGDSIDHQVAVWIPDDAPEGVFSEVVTYTVTLL